MIKYLSAAIARYAPRSAPTISVNDLAAYLDGGSNDFTSWNGSKFPGGFGSTQFLYMDYWALRERSGQVFTENMYARGIIRRLITSEINTGLCLEALPQEQILGYAEDELSEWTEAVENRFDLWAKTPELCDHRERLTFGGLQRACRMEALISGDVLQVIRIDPKTSLPRVQLISGSLIRTPMDKWGDTSIVHGVHLDPEGRHIGFWITQEDGTSQYLPAFSAKTGRKVARLIYGCQNRLDAVRGEPLLSVILQSLKEIDRYRDSAQRKATINSMLAMFIKKTQDKPGTLPISNAAVKRTPGLVGGPEPKRVFGISGLIPGLVLEELQQGEEPVPGSNAGTDVNLGAFEEVIVKGMSWALEIPPEILTLSFSHNYSASQAANNEYKIYLDKTRTGIGEDSCQPLYTEFLISECLLGKITAPGFLEAWRDPKQYDILVAWTRSDWSGAVKPSTDMLKQVKAYKEAVGEGWITNDRATRETNGTKFSQNIKRIFRENELKVKAATPIAEFRKKYGPEIADSALKQTGTTEASGLEDMAELAAEIVLDNVQLRA